MTPVALVRTTPTATRAGRWRPSGRSRTGTRRCRSPAGTGLRCVGRRARSSSPRTGAARPPRRSAARAWQEPAAGRAGRPGRAARRDRPAARGPARRRRPRPAHPAGRHQGRRLQPAPARRAPGRAEQQHELLATIEESRRPARPTLIANLLAMSRLQAGALSVARCSPSRSTRSSPGPCCDRHPRRVAVDVPDDLPLVLADPGLLERVVANLVDNACRFSRPTRPVQVRAEAPSQAAPAVRAGRRRPRARASRRSRPGRACFCPFQRLGDQDTATGRRARPGHRPRVHRGDGRHARPRRTTPAAG